MQFFKFPLVCIWIAIHILIYAAFYLLSVALFNSKKNLTNKKSNTYIIQDLPTHTIQCNNNNIANMYNTMY